MFRRIEFPQNAENPKKEGLSNTTCTIKVLVVDQKDSLVYDVDVLRSCSFEVTYVDHSFAALKVVAETGNEFDFLLIDRDITGVDVHTFLRLTRNLDIPAIAMSEQDDDAFELEAKRSGAIRIIKRPLTIAAVKNLHQHFIIERMYKRGKCNNWNPFLKTATQNAAIVEQRSSGSKRKSESSEGNNIGNDNHSDDIKLNKKTYLEWTPGLHMKFLKAVHQIGEESCCPKQIVDLMGVPGLTRTQVASHLQKWRRQWKSMSKQATPASSRNHTLTSTLLPQGVHERRHGRMPPLSKNQEESDTHLGMNLSINGRQNEGINMKNRAYGSCSLLSISNQKSARPQIQFIPIFFKTRLGSNQDEGCSSTINKTTTNYLGREISGVRKAGESSKHHKSISVESQDSDDEFPEILRDLNGNGPNDI